MSRLENTGKNFAYSLLYTVLTAVTSFVSRSVFIYTVGVSYLGANSLFTNILSMLSLTELGLSSAICFSLYAPLAKNDIDTIKSIMRFYKKAYRVIAVVITVIGMSLIPFLDNLIKDPGDIQHIPFIYVVFLYNTVISYLFTYKTTLLSADQKGYVMTNVNMVINIVTVAIQTIVLLIWKNYFIYLCLGAVINTVQWIFINRIIFKIYPYLKDKNVLPLNSKERKTIATNVKAMVFHKVGDLCINQTDNMIISSFIGIAVVGKYNNYYMIVNIINKFAQSIFNAATASIGNLIATESYERRYEVFKRYNFLGFWIFSWTGLCLYVLLTPFVKLWLGEEFIIDNFTIGLVMLNYYLVGMRVTVGNVKMAAGLYAQDQWVPIVQSVINLIVSIVGAMKLGLAGVFLGTVVSSICISCWYRPIIVYKYVFGKPAREYFSRYTIYMIVMIANVLLVMAVSRYIIAPLALSQIVNFFLMAVVCMILPNGIIIALFHKTEEFRYLMDVVKVLFIRRFRR